MGCHRSFHHQSSVRPPSKFFRYLSLSSPGRVGRGGDTKLTTQIAIRHCHSLMTVVDGKNPSVFASAFDPFVAILIQIREIPPKIPISFGDQLRIRDERKSHSQMLQCRGVELVLVRLAPSLAYHFPSPVIEIPMKKTYFEVSTLSELLATCLEPASEGLDLRMHNFVRPYIPSLSKLLSAEIT